MPAVQSAHGPMQKATALVVVVAFALTLGWGASVRAAPTGVNAATVGVRAPPGGVADVAPKSPYVTLQEIRDPCGTFQPYYAVSRFVRVSTARDAPLVPAIWAFRDTAQSQPPAVYPLANHGAVGAIYGLAYDAPRGILYGSAYLKRSTAFGPGGAGQIYA